MFNKESLLRYLKGSGIIVLVLLLILVSFYGIANNADDKTRVIFFSVFGGISGAIIIAYWVYAFYLERKNLQNGDKEDRDRR